MSTMIGQKLGSYLIEEKIGEGAMGVVFRAVSEKTGKTAAVKIITGDAGSKVNVPERFEREADILQQFRHPNIVRFLSVGRYRGTNYFAMEYLTGGTLEDVLEKRGPLPWREVVTYAMEVCDALHYAHQRNVIHRDLKPSNLLLSEKGQLKLSDFGIAKDLDGEALTAPGRTLGTAAYMAPEQIRGEPPISHKTDLYALGCLIYQMLAGEVPFKGVAPVVMMNQHLNVKPPRASLKSPNMPRALDDLVLSLMAKDVTKRPWDAEKVRVDLEELAAKFDRGEDVPMVFSGGDPARLGDAGAATFGTVAAPTGDHLAPESKGSGPAAPARAPRTTKPKKSSGSSFSILPADPRARQERLTTLGLVGLLVATAALIAFLLWPPGAKTLYRKAEALMASKQSSDWLRAETDYIAELDRRFPTKYVEEKQAWRDRMGLEKATRRAAVLEKPNLGRLSEPKPGAEATYVIVYNEAAGAIKAGEDAQAARVWRDLAEVFLKSKETEDRPWGLLCLEREKDALEGIAKRRDSVDAMLASADRLVQDGKVADATRLREDVVRRFGHIRSLRAYIQRRTGIDPAKPPETKDAPDAEKEAF